MYRTSEKLLTTGRNLLHAVWNASHCDRWNFWRQLKTCYGGKDEIAPRGYTGLAEWHSGLQGTWVGLIPSGHHVLLPSIRFYRTIHFTSCVKNNPTGSVWKAGGRKSTWRCQWNRLIRREKCRKPAHNIQSQSRVGRITVEPWNTKTRTLDTLCEIFSVPYGTVSCHFPQAAGSGQKSDPCKSFLFVLIYVCACDIFGKNIFSHLKGETREWMKRNKMDLQTRAGNQIITLTSNFGIRSFGYTILSLWFWLFNTKHPVLKGRLVVGLFIYFFLFKFWQNSSPSPCTNLREREREKKDSKKERGALHFLAFFLFNNME